MVKKCNFFLWEIGHGKIQHTIGSFSDLVQDIIAQLNACSDAQCYSSSQTTGLNTHNPQQVPLSENLEEMSVATFLELRRWVWSANKMWKWSTTKWWTQKLLKSGKTVVFHETPAPRHSILSFWAHVWFQQGSVHKPTVKGTKKYPRTDFCGVIVLKSWPEFNPSQKEQVKSVKWDCFLPAYTKLFVSSFARDNPSTCRLINPYPLVTSASVVKTFTVTVL